MFVNDYREEFLKHLIACLDISVIIEGYNDTQEYNGGVVGTGDGFLEHPLCLWYVIVFQIDMSLHDKHVCRITVGSLYFIDIGQCFVKMMERTMA